MQAKDFGYSVKVVEFGNSDMMSYEEEDRELKEIINLTASDKEQEMLSFLVLTPLKRAEKR